MADEVGIHVAQGYHIRFVYAGGLRTPDGQVIMNILSAAHTAAHVAI